ncbi:MAG: PAS domain S-box protein [Ferruginibacter sp.]
MKKVELAYLLPDQSNDLFWIIDADFRLIYANNTDLNLIKAVSGMEQKFNETVLLEGLIKGDIEKWKTCYKKGFEGTNFEMEDHLYHAASDVTQYRQITFKPVTGEDEKIFAVACQSRDITSTIKNRSEANRMTDASLDAFCSINDQGNFVYVSAAAANHWGYLPEQLMGKAYMELILENNVPKRNEIAAAIISGREIKSFVNRYRKRDGGIACNLGPARWDDDAKIMYCVARDAREKIELEEKILQN